MRCNTTGIMVALLAFAPVCFLNSQSVNPYAEPVYINKFTVESGLSQSTVNATIRDREGFLWIATDDGLNRFDGYAFSVFKHIDGDSTSLGNNQVKAVFEDSKARMWVGTVVSGLNLYDKNSASFSRVLDIPDPNYFGTNSILSITEDDNHQLWVGTYNGLIHLDPESRKYELLLLANEETHATNNVVYKVYKDRRNRIWVGTEDGYHVIDANTKKRTRVLTDQNGVLFNRVTSFYMDRQQRMWICTNGQGLFMLDERTDNYTRFSHDAAHPYQSIGSNLVRDITEVNGMLLIGTDGAGVSVMDPVTLKIARMCSKNDPSLMNAQVYNVHADRDNNVWIGSYGGGLKQISSNRKHFVHYEHFDSVMLRLGKNSVLALAEDHDKNIWIGTDGGGLYKFNPQTKKFTGFHHDIHQANGISGNVIKSLMVDSNGDIFAGTYAKGLNIIDHNSGKVKVFTHESAGIDPLSHNSVWSILQTSDKRIWVGTLGGLDEYIPGNQSFFKHVKNFRFPAITAFTIYEDQFHDLWFGTRDNGLYYYNRKADSVRLFVREPNGLSSSEIRDIFEDSKGRLWVAAINGGLNRFDYQRQHFIPLTTIVQKDLVSALEDEDGNFWMGSFHGLIRFNPETGETRRFDAMDGVQGNEFNYGSKLKSSSGELYFGGLNGLTVFRPEDIRDNKQPSTVALLDLYLSNKRVEPGDSKLLSKHINLEPEIVLGPDQNNIAIEYAAVEFSFPRKNAYAYKLENFDREWNYVGDQRRATYTNLPPGAYTFMVKSTNNDGIWNDEPKTVHIVVLRPWHKLQWVRLAFGMSLIVLVISAVRLRTGILMKQKRTLELLVEKRTEEIARQKQEIEDKSAMLEQAHEEIKVTNEELLRINSNLERLVDQRTLELRSTLQKLMETDQDLNTFLYRSSHDLRGPITTLMGLAQLAKAENRQEDLNRYFDKINVSCVHMLKLLKKLNETNMIFRTGTQSEKIDWPRLLEGMQQELLKLDPRREVFVSVNNALTGVVISDEQLLSIIVLNLMENGIIFRREHRPEVTLDLRVSSHQLIVVVKDNGIGIPDAIQDSIFDMFYRGSERSVGNGLGLFLVKKSVDLLRGSISVDSKINEYTIVTVTLPMDRQ